MIEAAVLEEINNAIAEKRFNDAQQLFNQLLGEFPHSFQVNLEYAHFLKEVGRLEEAREKLLDLNRKNAGNLIVLRELTNLAILMRDYQQAEIYIEQMLFFDAFNKEARQKQKEIEELKLKEMEIKLEDTQADLSLDSINEKKEQLPPIPPEDFEEILLKIPEESSDSELVEKNNSQDIEKLFKINDVLSSKIVSKPEIDDQELSSDIKSKQEGIFNQLENEQKKQITKEKQIDQDIYSEKEERDDDQIPKKRKEEQSTPVAEPFITVSTAELYLRQGQTKEALFIYQQLYQRTPEPDYLIKINELKKLYHQEKLMRVSEKLMLFLKIAQKRSKNNVL